MRSQIHSLRKQLKVLKDSGPVATRGEAGQLEEQLGETGERHGRKDSSPGVSAARGMVTIHSWLNQVYGSFDGADAAPTVQDLAMLGEVEKASAEQLNEFKKIRDGGSF